MRITFVMAHAGMAGGVRVVAIYAQRLMRRGHTVVVVSTPVPQLRFWDKVEFFLRGKGWPKRREDGPSQLDGTGVDHRVIDRFRPMTDADVPDADVIVATWWETAEWISRMSPRKGAKAYFIQHDETIFHHEKSVKYRERTFRTWLTPMKKITISQWLVDLARERSGEEAVLIPNSVDTELFTAPPRGKQARPTVGLLYSETPFKGCDISLRAFEKIKAVLPGARLRMFGAEPPTGALPIPPEAEFTLNPPQEKLREIYAGCDVWMCGSRSEGFHLPPLEAMACGCPVVGTAVGGVVETVKEGVNGYVVPIGDGEALADRVLRVLRLGDGEWRAMSAAAFERARAYTWDDATKLMEAALEEVVREAGGQEAGAGVAAAAR